MDNGLIARRYAKALFKLADEQGKSGLVYDEMKSVAKAFADNSDLQRTLSNPYINASDKEMLMKEAAGEKYEDDLKAFVKLIIQNHREEFIYNMCLAYCDIYREKFNISKVRIITADKYDDQRMERIHKLVEKAFPNRKFEYSEAVDKNLIGGFQIYVDNVKMDASISNELQQLRQNLL